jgi:hypothetical protein
MVQLPCPQACFEAPGGLLQVAPSGDYRFPVTTAMGTGELVVRVRLPEWECTQCILQWTYTAGNSWGVCPDGSGGLGCGPQEHFRACADIALSGPAAPLPSRPPAPAPAVTPPPAPAGPPAPATGQTSVAVGAWAGDPAMAAWCLTSCFAAIPQCPSDR